MAVPDTKVKKRSRTESLPPRRAREVAGLEYKDSCSPNKLVTAKRLGVHKQIPTVCFVLFCLEGWTRIPGRLSIGEQK